MPIKCQYLNNYEFNYIIILNFMLLFLFLCQNQ
uniref:Uncharacterized protein n=1 Tax=Siphoviridae sp. cthrG7 TaxID=2826428 RepID=A0A8S5MBZ4_9CAUD|nr:MAG TPA: hypothetical protein [Siphoviridae sp. cthrG7]